MGGDNSQKDKVLEKEFDDLGVSLDEMMESLNPPADQAAGDSVGSARGPLVEGKERGSDDGSEGDPDAGDGSGADAGGDDGSGQAAEGDEGQPDDQLVIPEEDLEEVMRLVKKKIGRAARKAAKKARKRYKRMKAKIKRKSKKWRKSAAGKRWLKKYARAKERFGGALKKSGGRKRLQIAGMDLSGRLREELSESQESKDPDSRGDLDILERGAVIAAVLGDRFEDMELPDDAESARLTSDNVVGLIDQSESEGKPVSDEDMTRAVKALGVVIDHYEKLGEAGEGSDLPLAR